MSRLILVLGMHRSGTSVITKSLESLGVSLGDNAEWYGHDNPAGFWEDRDVLAIDEALLSRRGVQWFSPVPTYDAGTWNYPGNGDAWNHWRDTDITSAARITMFTKTTLFPLLAIKEPRMCRMLPFWRDVLSSVGAEVSVVHVVRHPSAVARSLEKRNGLPIEKGLELWREHVERQYADVDPAWRQVTVRYEDFMYSAQAQLNRISTALALPWASTYVATRNDLWHEKPSRDPVGIAVLRAWDQASAKAAA